MVTTLASQYYVMLLTLARIPDHVDWTIDYYKIEEDRNLTTHITSTMRDTLNSDETKAVVTNCIEKMTFDPSAKAPQEMYASYIQALR